MWIDKKTQDKALIAYILVNLRTVEQAEQHSIDVPVISPDKVLVVFILADS